MRQDAALEARVALLHGPGQIGADGQERGQGLLQLWEVDYTVLPQVQHG